MAKRLLTDEQVEAEIKRLNQSEYVKLARKAERVKYARRQYLYTLRQLENKGRALMENGVNDELIDLTISLVDGVRSMEGPNETNGK